MGSAIELIELGAHSPLEGGIVGKGSRREGLLLTVHEVDGQDVKSAEVARLEHVEESDEYHTLIVKFTEGEEYPELTAHNLGGLLTMHQIKAVPILTDAIVRAQKAANAHKTGLHESGVAAAFRSIISSNAFPYVEKTDPVTGDKTLERAQFKMGHGAWINIVGVPTDNKKAGVRTHATPNITVIDPVSPQAFDDRVESFRRSILRRAGQEHRLINHNQASEVTVQELRRDFHDSVASLAREIASAYSWLLTTVLRLAATFAGEAKYGDVTVVAEASISKGVITSSDRKEAREAKGSGFLSHRTALGKYGIDDSDAEIALIEQERNSAEDSELDE